MRNYNTARQFDFGQDPEDFEELDEAPLITRRKEPYYKMVGVEMGGGATQPLPVRRAVPKGGATIPPPLPGGVPLPRRGQDGRNWQYEQEFYPSLPPYNPRRAQPRSKNRPKGDVRVGLTGNQARLQLVGLAVGGLIVCVLVYLLFSAGVKTWQTWQDDLTYGRPRTMQLDQFVGHNEQDGVPSHFIAQNNNRQITVIEYPGGDVSKTRVFQGPKLFGKEAELVPVKLHFEDVNGDKNVDMILSVDNQLIVYINQDSNFRPATADEKAKLKLQDQGR